MSDQEFPTGSINSRCRSSNAGWASRCRATFYAIRQRINGTFLRHTAAAAAPLLLIGICFSPILGCSSGSVAFDGGHIPVGGAFASVITGSAYAAEAYETPVPGATVTVTNTSISGDRRTQTTTTTATGAFAFANGFPDAANANVYQITVTPPPGSNRVVQEITFAVNAGQGASVLVALPQSSFNESLAASVTVLQQSYSLSSGETLEIGAELLDGAGAPLPVSPSLVFAGSFGKVAPGGLFVGTGSGSGSITAYWYTGSLQLQSNTAAIAATSTASGSLQPPAPPPPNSGSDSASGK